MCHHFLVKISSLCLESGNKEPKDYSKFMKFVQTKIYFYVFE